MLLRALGEGSTGDGILELSLQMPSDEGQVLAFDFSLSVSAVPRLREPFYPVRKLPRGPPGAEVSIHEFNH